MDKLEKPLHVLLIEVVQSVLLILSDWLVLILVLSEFHLTDVRHLDQSNHEALVVQFLLARHGVRCFQVRLNNLTDLRYLFHFLCLAGVDIHELLRINLLYYT